MTTPGNDIVQAIAAHLGDTVTADQVSEVLAALNAVRDGDPAGMVRRDPVTGKVAHRVTANGVAQWRVSAPDGEQYNDLQATLQWPPIFDPAGADAAVSDTSGS